MQGVVLWVILFIIFIIFIFAIFWSFNDHGDGKKRKHYDDSSDDCDRKCDDGYGNHSVLLGMFLFFILIIIIAAAAYSWGGVGHADEC